MGIQKNAYMCDLPFVIVEKSQIARPGLFQEADSLALRGLLIGVPQQRYVQQLEDSLGKAAAIRAKHRLSTPEIWCIQKFIG